MKSVSAVVGVGPVERFDVVARELFADISRKKIKEIIDQGGAYLNKKRIFIAKTPVKKGDRLELFWDEKTRKSEIKIEKNNIIYDSEGFLVLNKPPYMASQATLTGQQDTVCASLLRYFQEQGLSAGLDLHLVHRLDIDTSGLIIVAKNKEFKRAFEELFKEKKLNKVYHAFCFGKFKDTEGVLDWSLEPDPRGKNTYRAVLGSAEKRPDTHLNAKHVKSAVTTYRVLKYYERYDVSLVECFPKTGRTHQIRVHMLALGHPLLGDKVYSGNVFGHPAVGLATRQMLHAKLLQFDLNGENFNFDAPYFEDFLNCQRTLDK